MPGDAGKKKSTPRQLNSKENKFLYELLSYLINFVPPFSKFGMNFNILPFKAWAPDICCFEEGNIHQKSRGILNFTHGHPWSWYLSVSVSDFILNQLTMPDVPESSQIPKQVFYVSRMLNIVARHFSHRLILAAVFSVHHLTLDSDENSWNSFVIH